jgi:2',3'-cyclic-nucleotide 2'-phosphodiesterase (5'-nucleotidase family)
MRSSLMQRGFTFFTSLAILLPLFAPSAIAAPSEPVTVTILHTNDFHGQLESSGSNPGSARVAAVVNNVRTAVGASNVLLVDAGDEMQGSLLSNLEQGAPTIATFNAMGYNVATFGNHDFDWGQSTLADRTTQATYPFVTANIVQNDTGSCTTAGWTKPAYADAPYHVVTMGTAPNQVRVAFIGVTTQETPTITVSSATAGLCFKDPAQSILHYYDAMKSEADVIVVLSHLGNVDGGYGYGLPVYGDQTLATTLNTAGKPVNLILGGHSHTNMAVSGAVSVGTTTIAQAYYNGRQVGRANVTVDPSGSVGITWTTTTVSTSAVQDPTINALVNSYANDPDYLDIVNQPIGYSAVDLLRNYNGDNMMGDFIDDAIYNHLNSDGESANDVDMFFNNAGGIRVDWCYNGSAWVNTGCAAGLHDPALLTFGQMYSILPFGNATVVGRMTGAQIVELLNQSATLFKGAIQPSGIRFKQFSYTDANPGPQPWAWGAFDVTVYNKGTHHWDPLDLNNTYSVGTNEFLAPAGQDGFTPFKYMTDITYWGDMLTMVNTYVSSHFGSTETAYRGPTGDGALDGRITIDGDGDTTFDGGSEIVPLTILHHNDSHGNLVRGPYVSYTQLATLINQERAHNPTRTLLLSAGDNIQGDQMMYYFRTAPTGYASDGTPLAADLRINPLIKVFNSMNYDAVTLGNHEFNFGRDVFRSVLGQATFPLLHANVTDSGAYGLATTGASGIQPYVTKEVGAEQIKVAIMGIGNHLVPRYELPTNIPGLSFLNPLTRAQQLADTLWASNDVVIALTHIGFTENPDSYEEDTNVDTALAAGVTGISAIIGGHSHTNASTGFGSYQYLPAILANPAGRPVITTQAYRYNNTLGEVVLGLRPGIGGVYEVASHAGRYIYMTSTSTPPEDAAVKAIVDPYAALLTAHNSTDVGATTVPIDTLLAFTQETNGANLQADASVHELENVHGIPVDFHLSGAVSNRRIADGATPGSPVTLKISDLYSSMPYENSLVVLRMNGPQIKAILERGYRNYYYYNYVTGYGGYSHYTNCMLDTDASARIVYDDRNPSLPSGNNVVSLTVNGTPVNFRDSDTYYSVSTTNYLAAGYCNFKDGDVNLWPLDQIERDTQYYVRDAVIDYIKSQGTVSPAIDGRLTFGHYFLISGTLGASGAGGSVSYSGTTSGSTTADALTGNYSIWVPSGWSGTVTPVKAGMVFTPASRSYTNITSDMSGQDYGVLPAVTQISPAMGSAAGGTSVTITGIGFSGATKVAFGSVNASAFTVFTPTRISATSPAGTAGTSVHITVTTPAGTSTTSSADLFTFANIARNSTTGTLYTSLTAAVAAALAGNEIRILNTLLDGSFMLNKSVILYGGWDTTFLIHGSEPTTLNGSLTIANGDATARSLMVKGVLELQSGSLQVNGVTVAP